MKETKALAAVYAMGLERAPTVRELAGRLDVDPHEAGQVVKALLEDKSVTSSRGRLAVTARGRRRIRVVFIGGGFEVIHSGHMYTISKAKSLGDVLVVAVARDSTIRRRKKREPVTGEKDRAIMLASLRQVDAAILGVEGDIYETLERVRPDVVALGYDQHHLESDIEREGRKRGMRLEVVRLDSPEPGLKTSTLLRET